MATALDGTIRRGGPWPIEKKRNQHGSFFFFFSIKQSWREPKNKGEKLGR